MRNMQSSNMLVACIFSLSLVACQSKPKVITGTPVATDNNTSLVNDLPPLMDEGGDTDIHQVVAKEALNTERYTYVNVTEGEDDFWIAIPRSEVEIGHTYFYRGGLLKKNFQSREFNRVFETVYLVSGITDHSFHANGTALDEALSNAQGQDARPVKVTLQEGAISIADLFADGQKYEGKLVKVTGKCIKVNPMIMGRNWIHLQDGSLQEGDLTITTAENIPLGAVVSLEGTIALNKDFGAGYRYEIIMEEAHMQ